MTPKPCLTVGCLVEWIALVDDLRGLGGGLSAQSQVFFQASSSQLKSLTSCCRQHLLLGAFEKAIYTGSLRVWRFSIGVGIIAQTLNPQP